MALTCGKCGSDRVIPPNRIQLHQGNALNQLWLVFSVQSNPDALLMKGTVKSDAAASVCGDCGHVDWYASEFTELYEAYVASES